MTGSHRPEDTDQDGGGADVRRPCVALVPMVQPTEWIRPAGQLSRPASTFVTQLLATADHAPQTCGLRRASAADAQTAYGASRRPGPGAGLRTRQIV